MDSTVSSNSLSLNDSKRLEKSFFSKPAQKSSKKNKPEHKILIAIIPVVILIIIAATAFLMNFSIIIIPQHKEIAASDAVDLLHDNTLSTAKLINPQFAAKITDSAVYIDLPFNKKSGFSLKMKNKLDISNSVLNLVLRKPQQALKLFIILRDTKFFSNSSNPLEIEINEGSESKGYLTVPIKLTDRISSPVGLKRINQIRFIFHQEKKDFFPIFVKNVFLEKRR